VFSLAGSAGRTGGCGCGYGGAATTSEARRETHGSKQARGVALLAREAPARPREAVEECRREADSSCVRMGNAQVVSVSGVAAGALRHAKPVPQAASPEFLVPAWLAQGAFVRRPPLLLR